MGVSKQSLPKVLCLHGAGSSAAIFKVQSRKIQQALKDRFDFVFAEAPFETSAGPGIKPVFADSGPFFRWNCEASSSGQLDISNEDARKEKALVRQYLWQVLSQSQESPFVGIIAFSQGCRIATGLLLEQMAAEGDDGTNLLKFQFALLICATYPPIDLSLLSSDKFKHSKLNSTNEPQLLEGEGQRLRIKSVHVIGLQDPYQIESRKLLHQVYDEEYANCIEFHGGHHISSDARVVAKIQQAILANTSF